MKPLVTQGAVQIVSKKNYAVTLIELFLFAVSLPMFLALIFPPLFLAGIIMVLPLALAATGCRRIRLNYGLIGYQEALQKVREYNRLSFRQQHEPLINVKGWCAFIVSMLRWLGNSIVKCVSNLTGGGRGFSGSDEAMASFVYYAWVFNKHSKRLYKTVVLLALFSLSIHLELLPGYLLIGVFFLVVYAFIELIRSLFEVS